MSPSDRVRMTSYSTSIKRYSELLVNKRPF